MVVSVQSVVGGYPQAGLQTTDSTGYFIKWQESEVLKSSIVTSQMVKLMSGPLFCTYATLYPESINPGSNAPKRLITFTVSVPLTQ